jgi:hypothetical protein
MPLTKKGKKIYASMEKEYGKKKGREIFYASKNKGTIKGVEKARYGTMAKGDIKKGLEGSKQQRQKYQNMLAKVTMKLSGAQVSDSEANRIKKLVPNLKDSPSVRESKEMALKKIMKNMPKMKAGNMANLKPVPADKEKSLGQLPEDVRNKMGYAKKGKIMKASMGKSVRGYGAARTSGMGLEDQELPAGKSLDYYKDLM